MHRFGRSFLNPRVLSAGAALACAPIGVAHSHAGRDEEKNILFAVPKKGRLHKKIVELLKGSGFNYNRPDRLDVAHCADVPVTFVFLPASDIAMYVGKGDVDMGITGEDIVAESDVKAVVELMKMNMGHCRLSVQAPVKDNITDVQYFAGKRVATSFPTIATKFFEENIEGEPPTILVISGSVEAACGLGLADAVVDLVETGTTMRAAGLEEVATVIHTETVLIANQDSVNHPMVKRVVRRFEGHMTAQNHVMISYNVDRSMLSTAVRITPGRRSPNIVATEDSNVVSVSALVKSKSQASVMDTLEELGATDILVTALLSSRMKASLPGELSKECWD